MTLSQSSAAVTAPNMLPLMRFQSIAALLLLPTAGKTLDELPSL
jgi:hypothetical protein